MKTEIGPGRAAASRTVLLAVAIGTASIVCAGELIQVPLSPSQDMASVTNCADGAALTPDSATAQGLVRLNLRRVDLGLVLSYLGEAAGFTLAFEVQPEGTADLWSSQPVTKAEALNLLYALLNRNGYAALRQDQTLTIVNRDEVKTRSISVKLGNDPQAIPRNDEVVTQVIPVRSIEVTQLAQALQGLVSPRTTMTFNESANSVVITDTQANVHRIAEVIQAMDGSAETHIVVRAFRLRNADPVEMADLLAELFRDDSQTEANLSPVQFGGGPPEPGAFGGSPELAAAATTTSTLSQRAQKRARVTAVADQRTGSVVITAAEDMMNQIEQLVAQLDAKAGRNQNLSLFRLNNARPLQLSKVLQDLFQRDAAANNRSATSQTDALDQRSTAQSQPNSSTMTSGLGSSLGGSGGTGGGPSSSLTQ